MADILIKGLEMPESCYDCKFGTWDDWEQAYVCDAVNPFSSIVFFDGFKSDLISIVKSRRADNCPLVPLPEKYGRLIDADALKEKCWDATTRCDYVQVVDVEDIDDAPTIIPASEGGK